MHLPYVVKKSSLLIHHSTVLTGIDIKPTSNCLFEGVHCCLKPGVLINPAMFGRESSLKQGNAGLSLMTVVYPCVLYQW